MGVRNGKGMSGILDKIEKCNLTQEQIDKLKIPKFDSWFIHELRMEEGFEYFTQFDYQPNFLVRKCGDMDSYKFCHEDYWSTMFIPTSWFEVIGKPIEKIIEEVELEGNEDEDIRNAMIGFDTCHGVTRVGWYTFVNDEEHKEFKTNDLKITKFIKGLLSCSSFDV